MKVDGQLSGRPLRRVNAELGAPVAFGGGARGMSKQGG